MGTVFPELERMQGPAIGVSERLAASPDPPLRNWHLSSPAESGWFRWIFSTNLESRIIHFPPKFGKLTANHSMASPSGTLTWNLGQLAAAMHLTPEEVSMYFKDGRRVSFLLERRISREVIKGRLAESEGAGYDLICPKGLKWEVRSMSAGGIYFCPSYMVGSGRSFEVGGFLRKLDGVTGYVVSDIESFPDVPYWKIDSATVRAWWQQGKLGGRTSISRNAALALLRAL